MSKSRINWDIHLVKDGFQCEECGELVDCFIPHACDCHTHGLNQYHHLELQIVVNYQPHILAYILNSIGLMIKDGRQFGAGDKVEGIFEDCDLRFDDTVDDEGKPILRVVIPDKYNRWPEDPDCMEEYRHQLLPTPELYRGGNPIRSEEARCE